MGEVCFKLINKDYRPCLVIKPTFLNVEVLFDTGARVPVWTSGVELLKLSFPDARLIRRDCKFGGFGGTEEGDLWQFMLKIGKDLTYTSLQAIVIRDDTYENFPDLILGIDVFSGMSVELNYIDYTENRYIIFKTRNNDSFVRNSSFAEDEMGNIILTMSDSISLQPLDFF